MLSEGTFIKQKLTSNKMWTKTITIDNLPLSTSLSLLNLKLELAKVLPIVVSFAKSKYLQIHY